MDFLIGGVAGAGASFFTNPMDVIKTRLQLQGELKAPDSYKVRYRGFLHAIYVITKMDGITALQSGLTPALLLGFSLNFVRLGLYRKAERLGWTTDENGEISIGKSAFLASVSGALSGITATPNFVVKTRMQASANPNIAVGRQHKYKNTLDAFSQIFKKDGVKGFYVGFNATCTRLAVGSAVQMSSFSTVKELLLHAHHEHFVNSNALLAFSASSVSGLLVAIVMCPMDVITTRLYNQGSTGPNGKCTNYHGMMDCLKKSLHKEGIFGLYKDMDFLIGGVAGAGASFFTNPMDVIKTRLQLQGELKAPDSYKVRYRGFLHAIYVITKMDGITALQSGLTPALLLGFSLNFVRLGLYRKVERLGWINDENGGTSVWKAAFLASVSGGLSGITATPSFVVKARMQVSPNSSIAVGHQHKYKNTLDAFIQIFKKDGVKGFYAGVNATCIRLAVSSAVQISSFTAVKELLLHTHHEHFVNSNALLAFSASSVSGLLVAIVMCPMDVITTRLYNQESAGPNRKYTNYHGMMDCLKKSLHKEGIFGLYKGIGPFYLRIAPHTTLTLVLWDVLTYHFY